MTIKPDDDRFDAILSIDDPDFVPKFLEALGAEMGDRIEIVTPQFTRTDGVVPSIPDGLWWELKDIPRATLKAMGCCAWDEPDSEGYVLMLFPHEWYAYLPAGLPIVDLFGEQELFEPGKTDDDMRFGCLSYGVRVPA